MVVASGSVFQLGKGMGEGFGLAAGKSFGKRVRAGIPTALGRAVTKAPGAALLGLAVASGRRQGKKNTGVNKYLKPAVMGAIGGAGVNMTTKALRRRSAGKAFNLRKLMPAGKGGLVGGALGTALTALVVDKALGKTR